MKLRSWLFAAMIAVFATGPVACGSASSGGSTSTSAPAAQVRGAFRAMTRGPISSILFSATQYEMVKTSCANGASCVEEGTYALSSAMDRITLTDAKTKTATTYAFKVTRTVNGSATASTAVHTLGGGSLFTGDGGLTQGGTLLLDVIEIAEFLLDNTIFYTAPDAGAWDPSAPVSASCGQIVNGTSSLGVNGTNRNFEVQLPSDTSGPMALLFLWHGFMQSASTFASTIVYDVPSGQWVPFDPNAFPMPLMIVAPDDLGLFVVGWDGNVGLDWDIGPQNPPLDFPFFEAMLQCINQQFTIDSSRVYSFGFSAGAVFTDLLSAEYPDLFAATISESGAWFNDPAEQQQVLVNNLFPFIRWEWPSFNPADRGNVLLTHGGPNDFATIISLQNANEEALPFLNMNSRTVVECAHDFGHALDPDLTQEMYYTYMWAHQLGGPALSELPGDFPTASSPVGETSCYFHPAP